MVDRVNPIVPGNPDLFPVPPVGHPRVDPEERERRRREREREREEALREQERARPRRGGRPPGEEGGGQLDVTV